MFPLPSHPVKVNCQPCIHIQGNSEKCTGAFKFGYRVISIYPKVAAKAVSSVIYISNSHKK